MQVPKSVLIIRVLIVITIVLPWAFFALVERDIDPENWDTISISVASIGSLLFAYKWKKMYDKIQPKNSGEYLMYQDTDKDWNTD